MSSSEYTDKIQPGSGTNTAKRHYAIKSPKANIIISYTPRNGKYILPEATPLEFVTSFDDNRSLLKVISVGDLKKYRIRRSLPPRCCCCSVSWLWSTYVYLYQFPSIRQNMRHANTLCSALNTAGNSSDFRPPHNTLLVPEREAT
ncbi:unnamed protein product [Allacma fusca]|uniref:Uncharacterized protein n=1 Tax=Allacma fusca TaxID=39272 RepID=A0A8J2PGY3_9HEXA|nr:unnamed protein product [Allacma fusca]